MKIYLIRHGESTSDIENRFGGHYDDDLTDLGLKQAKELVQKLKSEKIDIIFSSPFKRANQTAQILKNTFNCKLEIVEDLKERNRCGFLSGMKKDEASKKYPEEFKLLQNWENTIKGAENYEIFKNRIKNVFKKLITFNNQNMAIVTHGGPINVILEEFFNMKSYLHLKDCAMIKMELNNKNLELITIDN
jgi:broad specificity phosphatase PhoE